MLATHGYEKDFHHGRMEEKELGSHGPQGAWKQLAGSSLTHTFMDSYQSRCASGDHVGAHTVGRPSQQTQLILQFLHNSGGGGAKKPWVAGVAFETSFILKMNIKQTQVAVTSV